jgi:hypothetical protein
MTRLLAAIAVLLATPALAGEMATADQIRAAIVGNTVQGDMSDGTAYTEFYGADGTIKGKDYSGTWTFDADRMCFAYGADPICFDVAIAGDKVTWMSGGAPAGTGTILPGNPNQF